MKKLATALGLFLLTIPSFAQENNEILTPIKPADAAPATFMSQEHMDEKKAGKIDAIKQEILANQDDLKKVNALREKLWRFENAIIVQPK